MIILVLTGGALRTIELLAAADLRLERLASTTMFPMLKVVPE